MSEESKLNRFREEMEAKQRGLLWPDMLRSGRSVDEFLWKGSPAATPVQRVGLALFAIIFLFFTTILVVVVFTQDNWAGRILGGFFAIICGVSGIRFLMNAFRRGAKPRKTK
jgi:hypothetical protein